MYILNTSKKKHKYTSIYSQTQYLMKNSTIVDSWIDAIKKVIFITTVNRIGSRRADGGPAFILNAEMSYKVSWLSYRLCSFANPSIYVRVMNMRCVSSVHASKCFIERKEKFDWHEARLITAEIFFYILSLPPICCFPFVYNVSWCFFTYKCCENPEWIYNKNTPKVWL